eukprot:PhF_6_TR32345/c0_g1_i2/m.47956
MLCQKYTISLTFQYVTGPAMETLAQSSPNAKYSVYFKRGNQPQNEGESTQMSYSDGRVTWNDTVTIKCTGGKSSATGEKTPKILRLALLMYEPGPKPNTQIRKSVGEIFADMSKWMTGEEVTKILLYPMPTNATQLFVHINAKPLGGTRSRDDMTDTDTTVYSDAGGDDFDQRSLDQRSNTLNMSDRSMQMSPSPPRTDVANVIPNKQHQQQVPPQQLEKLNRYLSLDAPSFGGGGHGTMSETDNLNTYQSMSDEDVQVKLKRLQKAMEKEQKKAIKLEKELKAQQQAEQLLQTLEEERRLMQKELDELARQRAESKKLEEICESLEEQYKRTQTKYVQEKMRSHFPPSKGHNNCDPRCQGCVVS